MEHASEELEVQSAESKKPVVVSAPVLPLGSNSVVVKSAVTAGVLLSVDIDPVNLA